MVAPVTQLLSFVVSDPTAADAASPVAIVSSPSNLASAMPELTPKQNTLGPGPTPAPALALAPVAASAPN